MKTKLGFLLILLLLIGGCGSVDSVQQHVEKSYTNEDGLIYAYPDDPKSEYLSESIGLYMEYLVLIKDEKTFHEQYELLKAHFVTGKNGTSFVFWRLNEQATTNALIDDVRIIEALQQAATLFGREEYAETATTLGESIASVQQQDGSTVDFYDWTLALPAQRLTLSYVSENQWISDTSLALLKNTESTEIFFPEYYDTKQQSYKKSNEVHLIDQLLIAMNRQKLGEASPTFLSWVKKEWTSDQRLYGRYDRKTQQPTVDYESLAVYYYLHAYLTVAGEEQLAREVFQRATALGTDDLLNEAHFFDYMHYQLLLENSKPATDSF